MRRGLTSPFVALLDWFLVALSTFLSFFGRRSFLTFWPSSPLYSLRVALLAWFLVALGQRAYYGRRPHHTPRR